MLDKLKPYPLDFIQKASPGKGDAFDYAYIYKFYTERTAISQRLKYIIRVEAYEDVFAVKFLQHVIVNSITNTIVFFVFIHTVVWFVYFLHVRR